MNDETRATQPRRRTLEEMIQATDDLRKEARPDADWSPVTKEEFDALWEEPSGDFSLTDIRSAL